MSIEQLRLVEQHLQQVTAQKRHYQQQLLEIEHATDELKGSTEAYALVGSIMIKKESSKLSAELSEKKELYDTRVTTLIKEEQELRSQLKELQEEVLAGMEGEANE